MRVCGAQVMPCPAEDRPTALEMLYRRMPRSLRGYLIAEVLEDERRGELDLSGLWIARIRSGRIVGAMMTQALAGKTAALWPPEVGPSWRRAAVAAAMVDAALADLSSRGYRLVQAALDESAGPRAASDLIRGGMPRVTELLYLERETAASLDVAAPSGPDFVWRPFEPAIEGEFREVLTATYEGSLDMPELEGRGASRISSPATAPPGCSAPSGGMSGGSPASPGRPPSCCSPRRPGATSGRSSTSG